MTARPACATPSGVERLEKTFLAEACRNCSDAGPAVGVSELRKGAGQKERLRSVAVFKLFMRIALDFCR